MSGQLFVFFVMTVAAAEVAVGLALMVASVAAPWFLTVTTTSRPTEALKLLAPLVERTTDLPPLLMATLPRPTPCTPVSLVDDDTVARAVLRALGEKTLLPAKKLAVGTATLLTPSFFMMFWASV